MKTLPLARWILTLLTWSVSVAASRAFEVTGRVASATDDTPLAGATVQVYTLPDTAFVGGAVTDAKGLFQFYSPAVKRGVRCHVAFSYIGYVKTYKTFTVRDVRKPFDLKDVYMQEDERLLGEAIVSATPPPMVIREDTIEYYADSYKTQPDATAEDLLKRLPGVEVATDGSITAQGETVQQVYIDGKEFFGENALVATKNITADMIESVQVVDMQNEESRLTGIDDGDRRKVINLKLKPKMRRGWFGNAAAAWGAASGLHDRYEGKGMAGYFRGDYQNALVANANNTNNTGFGDLGAGVFDGSAMRAGRTSGARGDGLNESWSVGLNVNYDKGNRMRDANTPFALGGNALYGGSQQDEATRTHRVNYLRTGNTVADSYATAHNDSRNVQANVKFERTFGTDGQHRIQIRPTLAYNATETDESSTTTTQYEDSAFLYNNEWHDRYISQTQRSSYIKQQGVNYGLNVTYSYMTTTARGRRRSSITVGLSGRVNDGDHYTRSYTSYDSLRVADLTLTHDTLIHQWQEEKSHNETYRVRVTHVEPIAERHFLELSGTASWQRRASRQTYHFWDPATEQYADTIDGRTNADYNSDTRTTNGNYTASLSYRTVQERYNLNVGLEVLPQTQRYTDDLDPSRDYSRHYINYSPRLTFRYNWSRRKNLRIQYSGRTQQPTMSQLQARKNQTSATHVRLGNKDLDPSFSNTLDIRFRSVDEATFATLEATLRGGATFDNLTTKRWYSDDLRTDTTMTVNLDGLGDWNVEGSFRGSFPFYDNLWYVTTDTQAGYDENVGYANVKNTDSALNHARKTTVRQQAGIAYRGEKLNVELRGNYRMQYATATVTTTANLGTTHTYGGTLTVHCQLPWDLAVSSDLHYTARRGFSAGIDREQTIWNAQASKSFLTKRNLTAFVKVFDILKERSSISRSITATAMTDRETTTLGQYFLVGMSMKFNDMGPGGRSSGRGNRGGDRPSRPL